MSDAAERPGAAPRAPWTRLLDTHFDLAVVGGGIHGAGVARDAALRGLSVALIEQRDWASGTSSRSSKLLHGGLRYLRHGQLGLVRAALHERELHCRLAPEWTRRVEFVVPRPVRGHRAWVRAGIALYGVLAGRPHAARFWAADPAYEDVMIDDAGFVLALVQDASAHDACCLNYVRWLGWSDGRSARVRDQVSGAEGILRAHAWVHAAGPWAGDLVGRESSPLRLTRGTHVILDGGPPDRHPRLFFSSQDQRPLFLLPYHETYWLLGTTDLDDPQPLADPVPHPEEFRYLQRSLVDQFPNSPSWKAVGWQCGQRPLVRADGDPGRVSREERVVVDTAQACVTILGGKYTGYRTVAAQAVDAATPFLDRKVGPCRTASLRFPAPEASEDFASQVRQGFAATGAIRLEDVLERRTRFADWGGDTDARVAEAAALRAEILGSDAWSVSDADAYVRRRDSRRALLRLWES